MKQMSPFELEKQGFKLKEVHGCTEFPERDPETAELTGRVYQYYEKDGESYALLVQEPTVSA